MDLAPHISQYPEAFTHDLAQLHDPLMLFLLLPFAPAAPP